MWYLFALLSALFASVRKTNEKQLSYKLNHFTIGWSVQFLSLPIIFIALLAMGTLFNPFTLGSKFWLPTLAICIGFYPLNTFLYINALKHGELSKTVPLQSLGPIFGLLLGWIFVGQKPTLLATLGITIVVAGVYVLNLKGKYLHSPLKIFTADKANLYTLFAVILSTCAGVLDIIAIKASEPIYYCFVCTLGASIVLYMTSLIFKVREFTEVKQSIKSLSVTGTMFGGTFAMYLMALNSGPLAYVSAIRTSAILVGAVIGGLWLKESITKIKIIALVFIGAGSIILGLS
jgi:drug/metabolite transporter (DMT)-like permease